MIIECNKTRNIKFALNIMLGLAVLISFNQTLKNEQVSDSYVHINIDREIASSDVWMNDKLNLGRPSINSTLEKKVKRALMGDKARKAADLAQQQRKDEFLEELKIKKPKWLKDGHTKQKIDFSDRVQPNKVGINLTNSKIIDPYFSDVERGLYGYKRNSKAIHKNNKVSFSIPTQEQKDMAVKLLARKKTDPEAFELAKTRMKFTRLLSITIESGNFFTASKNGELVEYKYLEDIEASDQDDKAGKKIKVLNLATQQEEELDKHGFYIKKSPSLKDGCRTLTLNFNKSRKYCTSEDLEEKGLRIVGILDGGIVQVKNAEDEVSYVNMRNNKVADRSDIDKSTFAKTDGLHLKKVPKGRSSAAGGVHSR